MCVCVCVFMDYHVQIVSMVEIKPATATGMLTVLNLTFPLAFFSPPQSNLSRDMDEKLFVRWLMTAVSKASLSRELIRKLCFT